MLQQADTVAAQPAGGLHSEVLAMCGVDAPLRRLDLAAPAEALSRLDSVDCPLEGINCLQVQCFLLAAGCVTIYDVANKLMMRASALLDPVPPRQARTARLVDTL